MSTILIWIWIVLSVILTLTTKCSSETLSSSIPRCHIDDQHLDDCLLNSAKKLKPYIAKGIPDLGIPPYQPLVITNMYLEQHAALANYRNHDSNFTVNGLQNYSITEFKYNPRTLTFTGKIGFKSLYIESVYTFDGRLLSIPIVGDGIFNVTLGPVNATFKIIGKLLKRNNIEHYYPTSVEVLLLLEDMNTHIGGLFGNNTELAGMTNQMVNDNSKMICTVLTPVFETVVETYLMRYTKWLTKKYPYHELFPHSA